MTTIREKALNVLVVIDKIATYVPVVCVVSAALSAIFKKCVVDNLSDKKLYNNSYFIDLEKKSYKRCGAEFFGGILLPIISNIAFGIFDLVNWSKERKTNKIHDLTKKAKNGDFSAVKQLKKLNQVEPLTKEIQEKNAEKEEKQKLVELKA
jgi:hypothetical protein